MLNYYQRTLIIPAFFDCLKEKFVVYFLFKCVYQLKQDVPKFERNLQPKADEVFFCYLYNENKKGGRKMNVLKAIIGVIVFSGIALLSLRFYTQSSYDEVAGVLDQLNPLVPRGELYVKTKKPDKVNPRGTATYIQQGADKYGHKRTIEFSGLSVLKEARYLKIKNKGAYVETYEEVDKKSVPEKALAIIE